MAVGVGVWKGCYRGRWNTEAPAGSPLSLVLTASKEPHALLLSEFLSNGCNSTCHKDA